MFVNNVLFCVISYETSYELVNYLTLVFEGYELPMIVTSWGLKSNSEVLNSYSASAVVKVEGL